MLISLIGKNKIYKLVLSETPMGSYWITDKTSTKERDLINIEESNGKWQVISNEYSKIIDWESIKNINFSTMKFKNENINIIKKIELQEYQMYPMYIVDLNELFILYCSPIYDQDLLRLKIKQKQEIIIGRNSCNQISYNNKLVSEQHARMFFYNGKWRIENLDNKYGTFINNRIIEGKEKALFNGDIIFIMGLKIIILGDTLIINNPNQKMNYNKDCFLIHTEKVENYIDNEEIEKNIDLYDEEEFFSKAPRIIKEIECEKIKIDAPPQKREKEDVPLILTLGSSLSMGIMMLISMVTAIDGVVSGTSTPKQMTFSLITSFAMLVGMILFPILSARYNKNKKIKYEKKRQKRYKEYLNNKSEAINQIMENQRNILNEKYPSPEECTNIILKRDTRLWERKIDEYDFLTVRLGIGEVPLNVEISFPEEKFEMEDDNLVDILNNIAMNAKSLKAAPIVTSLIENNVIAIISKNNQKIKRFMQSLIVQLITFQSYEDIKLVFLLKEDKLKNWEYVKILPHVWDNTKKIRFFADNKNDIKEILNYLEEELKNRTDEENNAKDYKSFLPYYLIITDDYKSIENYREIKEILKSETNHGFSILCIDNDLMKLPNECKTFINIDDKNGMIYENKISSLTQKSVKFDTSVILFFEKICEVISNIPIKITAASENFLPNTYSFLEMYNVGKIEQLNIFERWTRNDSTVSLEAPLGIDGTGNLIMLDIHEKAHGPHGLIAGSTGSGKSEFIITYILSLAVNYHPDDLTFILIDYKGGGLAGAFQKGRIKLPHLVGTITNIDTNGLQRSLASIQSELKRRQRVFNEARNMTDEGTIDIYKYQKLYHKGIVKEPVPHLLIICDEFAELKQQQPEFMDELMSVSRIGRSLGVHLILATQKPAGIVNEQIRSNSKFSICLKVQDKADSNDVINKPDAASLKKVGQFYMKVGNDEYFVLGQSAWSGAPYFPTDHIEKRVDNSVEFISNIGETIQKASDKEETRVLENKGEQLTNIVKYLHELSEQNEIKTKKLWLDDIPPTIYVEDVRKKYNVKVKKNNINPVIGEYDDPFNQRQGVVSMNFSEQGNTIVYGNAESGKETLLSTMIYDIITTHKTEEANVYLLDFGTEALRIYNEAPQVGDIIFINESEKIQRFFDMLQKEIKERKEKLANYNGEYQLYLEKSGEAMPMMIIVLNNYEAFSEIYEREFEDVFLTLTRECVKCGITFVVTVSSSNSMRYRLSQNFKQKIVLQLNNDDEYFNVIDARTKKRPAHIFGRGLVFLEEEVYEFQTAKICDTEQYNIHIQEKIEEAKERNQLEAPVIPVLPKKVTFDDLKEELKDLSKLPIGIAKKDLKICTVDYKKSFINIIVAKNIEEAGIFAMNLVEVIKKLEDVKTAVFDIEGLRTSKKIDVKTMYNALVSAIMNASEAKLVCIIIGVDKFLKEFEDMDNSFYKTIKELEKRGNCNFILVDSVNKLKSHDYDEWYKNYVSKENGIWVGNGIENQNIINVNLDRKEVNNNCGRTFGYSIKKRSNNNGKTFGNGRRR